MKDKLEERAQCSVMLSIGCPLPGWKPTVNNPDSSHANSIVWRFNVEVWGSRSEAEGTKSAAFGRSLSTEWLVFFDIR